MRKARAARLPAALLPAALLPAALLLAALAGAEPPRDHSPPPQSLLDHVEGEGGAALWGALQWAGPARGCARVDGDEPRLECALPAGRVTLAADRAATRLKITCQEETDGGYSVEELERAAGAALRNLTAAASGPRALRSLWLQDCALAGPLRRLPPLLGATGSERLQLAGLRAPPLPDHVRGLADVTYLRLLLDDRANVSALPFEALAELPALERLDVHGGALRLAEGEARWARVPRLRLLELAAGALRALPARAFAPLANLTTLSLWSNAIEEVDEDAFEGLSQLQVLSLNHNRVSVLPARALLPVPQLRTLHLYNNRVRALPPLTHLASLEEVWVNNRNGTSLELQNDTFAGLSALRQLKLESCALSALPPALLRGCGALRSLLLAGNRLEVLPPALLSGAPALTALDLSRNRLQALAPRLFEQAGALEELDLSANRLAALPADAFVGLAGLRTLRLARNRLADLHPDVFKVLQSLTSLSLEHNLLALDAAPDAAGRARSPLAGLQALQRVDLSHNAVRRFMHDWVELSHLETLNLSFNEITNLTDLDLQMYSGTVVVDVRHNKIELVQQLPAAELDAAAGGLSRARFLLDDNPFRCDCRMHPFLATLNHSSVEGLYRVAGARCAAPPALAGLPLAAAPLIALQCALPAPLCPAECACAVRPHNSSLELNCAAVPPALRRVADRLRYGVRLRVRAPPADVTALPSAVRVLDLSGLNLTAAPRASAPAPGLTVDLSRNLLAAAPIELLDANCQVLLGGNPLACDCEHRESMVSLRRRGARVLDAEALRCADGRPARALDAAALCAARDALALGLGSGLAAALLVLLAFRYRTEIRLLLGRCSWFDFLLPKQDAAMLDKKYDLFVSYSHCDEAFVRGALVPALEGGARPLRLCLHYRDWQVGGYIPDQIARSVELSWRTIVVLSEDFVKSVWGRHEFRAAHGLERVIVLVLGDALDAMEADPELRAYKRTHTCILASQPLVWDRIRDAVYRSRRAAPAAPAPRAPAAPPAGLHVQLRDGKLVNELKTLPPEASVPPPRRLPFLWWKR